ncbi:nuclease-related domain-containing DEAD/DEAH box helicase [Williamsia serinedens]|uniref:UvrD-like helicase C-terminal domain-containing protein n=1 Tax=Williamsia serinedens TaxID=391736 RepID=A0ABT1H1D9_9NOCA|nr:ATP-binding domain-containing protein [Williamsia serinedens]MCP2160794.1 UvrD-like helicase C-terminal domain-containing protein [Williamsia serinedens]
MAQTIPAEPRFANSAEKKVYQCLVDQFVGDDLIVVGQRVTDHDKDHEIDFVVAIDGVGIVCLEVKAGEITHDGADWWQGRDDGRHRIDPVAQVLGACYALRSFVEADPRWTQGRVRWTHMVVFPHTSIAADFALPDCPRWKVIDRDQLDQFFSLLRAALIDRGSNELFIGSKGIEELQLALGGRGLPQHDVVARAQENEDSADILSEQQVMILHAASLLPRVEVRGGAGSGKTFLAMEKARRMGRDGKRVALVCYSHGLASFLRRTTDRWSRREQPAYVGEFHELGKQWGAPAGPDEGVRNAGTVRFWEHELPAVMAGLAEELPPGKRFDAIVVDEAQDFADDWWTPLLACLRDPENGGVYVFSDEGQRVFDRQGSPPVPLVPLILDANIRNTRQIAKAFTPLVGQRMRMHGGDGPAVRFISCSPHDAVEAADGQVELLIDEGWRYEDIALLTTGSRHPVQAERQAEGNVAYWDTFWDGDDIFFGHVLGFKGLERNVVVLAMNQTAAHDRSKERLYVGLSRAREQLVVCGDPAFVLEVGGPELARRLGLN